MNGESTRGTILVTGATGQQGGAVARHLLAEGFSVRALTRNPDSEKAASIAGEGAELVQGDLNDPASLEAALKGVDGVFGVQNFWESGVDGEVKQGINLADAVKAAGIRHFVYSSVGGAERNTGIPHFDSKWKVEEHIRSLGIPATILRPVFFMENFGVFSPPSWDGTTLTLTMALPADRKLQMIAADDIGAFAALAFQNPDDYIGKAVELAGDELTPVRIAEKIGANQNVPGEFSEMPLETLRGFSEEVAVMYEWFATEGYTADISALRSMYPGLKSFEAWLNETSVLDGLTEGDGGGSNA